ncbi:putative ankyrin repeat protein [Anaeromyces robustus]|uniref:Putative ankyrin repeat protein n=1 Tax=Anaeromyces robustus TaxID=1754192 RepID=A0A1Y1XGG2_9FUNG|nr:putative ankyrin repeat protein [Anaeromyces robustus]|eukprot:ORX84803.1 putative ankyrin repeat protein [Anaeromyces robustus]
MLVNKYGAYIYIKDNENNTLLHIGAKSGNLTTPLLLFSKEYNIDIQNNKGETPLHKACIQNRYKKEGTIDKLLKRGANINAQDNEGNTPLINLSRTTLNEDNVIFLINQGADINKPNNKGETPLIIACKYGRKKIVKVLLDYGADINKQDNEGNTPLHMTCKYYKFVGEETLMEYLIKREANINILNNEGETPIFEACRYLYSNVLKIFIKNGAKLNIKNKYGDSLLKVVYLYNIENIEFLIDVGVK